MRNDWVMCITEQHQALVWLTRVFEEAMSLLYPITSLISEDTYEPMVFLTGWHMSIV